MPWVNKQVVLPSREKRNLKRKSKVKDKKINKPTARFIKKKQKTGVNKIRNEKGEAITDITETEKIMRLL